MEAALFPTPQPNAADLYSDKILVRIPKDVHRDLLREAERQGVSLNLLAATVFARAVGHLDPEERNPGRPRRTAPVSERG